MPQTPSNFIKRLNLLALAFLCLGGCRSAVSQAQHAFADYQNAMAANDLPNARKALLALVNVQDDVADNWVELGKLQASMGAYGDAQYAFTRAYELNRRDPEILRAVTQLDLRSGDFPTAQTHARELELLAPSDPWIKIADGYVALNQSRFEDALAISNSLLSASPFDSNGKVLKARALLGEQKFDEALALLTAQIAFAPRDVEALRLAEKIYEQRGDWRHVAEAAHRLSEMMPVKRDMELLFISASFKSGASSEGRKASLSLLNSTTDPSLIVSILDTWADYWPSPQRISDASLLGTNAHGQARMAYADFLNRMNDPSGAISLVGLSATLPVDSENAQANAVKADALARSGSVAEAGRLFDAVLSFDGGNPTALRGRAELRLRNGQAGDATADAQKLVSVLTQSSRARLLLARCFAASGNAVEAENTLWDGFHTIPNSEALFEALKASMQGNSDAISRLTEEYTQQRNAELYRGII
jgi:tetratricopeptide (TPR) repeat protein